MVRDSVEEMLKELLEKEAESLMQAACYERSETRQGYHRSGHYDWNLTTTTSGDATLQCSALGKVSLFIAVHFWNEKRGCDDFNLPLHFL